MKHSTVWIDGLLYAGIAVFPSLITYFSSDDAYKYCNPYFLFWLKGALVAGASICGGLKMFRSQIFGKMSQQDQQTPAEKIKL